MGRLDGRVAIVTGAAQGIGLAIAKAYLDEGAKVLLADIDATGVAAAAKKLDRAEHTAATGVDIADKASVDRMVAFAAERFGGIDILVNNAALWKSLERRPFYEIPQEEWDRVFAVNTRGPFLCSAAVTPYLQKSGRGKIIFIGSSAIWTAQASLTQYVSSKSALIGLMRCIGRELGAHKVCVNMIHPGITDSGGVDRAFLETRSKNRFIQRVADPEDLTGTAVFLASADSDFITGQQFHVDGGTTIT